jgi:phosphoribosyl 1,2-cyclic phosphodiesterase
MTMADFSVHFWGVRGSLPACGPTTDRSGGHTSMVEMRCGDRVLIFDTGSAAKMAGDSIYERGLGEVDVFFSHFHYDHIIGLPFFFFALGKEIRIGLWSGHLNGPLTTRELVERFMAPPFFPVTPAESHAKLDYHDFDPGETLAPGPGISIRTMRLNHPGGAVGYRVTYDGRSAAYVTDVEHQSGEVDSKLTAFLKGADLVIYDAAYTDSELVSCRGYGHSTWQHGVKLAKAAAVKRFALFHHCIDRTDDQLDAIEKAAKARFPGTFAAREGTTVTL